MQIHHLRLFALCCCVLSLQMLLLAAMTAARRAKVLRYNNPEDKAVSPQAATLNDDDEHPEVARIQRAHRNLLESLPLFFGLGVVYLLIGASYRAAPYLFLGFTGARVLHSIVYLRAMQPLRTITYAVGAFALTGMIVLIVRTVFKSM
ncbi:MAG: MAPEG family protein [Polyangiales bacterium]